MIVTGDITVKKVSSHEEINVIVGKRWTTFKGKQKNIYIIIMVEIIIIPFYCKKKLQIYSHESSGTTEYKSDAQNLLNY